MPQLKGKGIVTIEVMNQPTMRYVRSLIVTNLDLIGEGFHFMFTCFFTEKFSDLQFNRRTFYWGITFEPY